MKSAVKILSLVLVFYLTTSMMSASHNIAKKAEKNTSEPTVSAKAGETEVRAYPESGSFGKYKPGITLTQNRIIWESMVFQQGEDVEYNEFTRWAKDKLGITWKAKWIVSDMDANRQKINVAYASDDLPDVLRAPSEDIIKMAKTKTVIPMDELINRYGSQLTKYIYDEFQKATENTFFLSNSHNGHIYGIPTAADVWALSWSNLFIRTDILHKLGKSIPTTLGEMESILEEYKKVYPDNTGLVIYTNPQGSDRIRGMEVVMNAFEAYPHMWVDSGSGTIEYGSTQPQVKKALEVLRRWYEKGYLDKEFILKNFDKAREPFIEGNALAIYGNWWYSAWPFRDFREGNPDAILDPVPTLQGPDGKQGNMFDALFTGEATAVNSKCKNPEAVIYMLNEVLDSNYRNDEKLRTIMRGKGYEFKYPVTTIQKPLNPEEKNQNLQKFKYENPGFGFFNNGANHGGYVWGIGFNERVSELYDAFREVQQAFKTGNEEYLSRRAAYEIAGLKPSKAAQHLLFNNLDLFDRSKEQGIIQYSKFAGATTDTMREKEAYLKKLEDETFCKIIMGQIPSSDFDKFVQQWKSSGGEQITREVNEWYESTVKK